MAVELNPWVEYEFRVVASNAIGTGDPSTPSRGVRTKEAGKPSETWAVMKLQEHIIGWSENQLETGRSWRAQVVDCTH